MAAAAAAAQKKLKEARQQATIARILELTAGLEKYEKAEVYDQVLRRETFPVLKETMRRLNSKERLVDTDRWSKPCEGRERGGTLDAANTEKQGERVNSRGATRLRRSQQQIQQQIHGLKVRALICVI